MVALGLVELLEDNVITHDEFFYGGGQNFDLTADMSITHAHGRMLSFDPDASGHKVMLPAEETTPLGGPHFYLSNNHASRTIEVVLDSGSALITIPADSMIICVLGLDASSNNKWYAF